MCDQLFRDRQARDRDDAGHGVTRHSDVDHHVAVRPGAADEDISLRRWIERIRLVADGPGDQSALAVVTDARAARPPDGYVARFRELEKTRVVLAPANGDAAPRRSRPSPAK